MKKFNFESDVSLNDFNNFHKWLQRLMNFTNAIKYFYSERKLQKEFELGLTEIEKSAGIEH